MSLFSVYVDIAGRVTEHDRHNAPIVSAAVAIDPRARDEIRACIIGIPKWRDATAESFERVVGVMETSGAKSLALKVSRIQPAWSRFFQEGRRVQRRLSEAGGSSSRYLKPGTVLRTFLLGNATVRLLAECAKTLTDCHVVDAHGRTPVIAEIVNDGELSGEENEEVYRQEWAKLVSMQNVFKQRGFGLRVESIHFTTEHDEPLLLLPDYLAGCFLAYEHRHARRPQAVADDVLLHLATRLFAAPGVRVNFEDFAEKYAPSVSVLADDPIARAAVIRTRKRTRVPAGAVG